MNEENNNLFKKDEEENITSGNIQEPKDSEAAVYAHNAGDGISRDSTGAGSPEQINTPAGGQTETQADRYVPVQEQPQANEENRESGTVQPPEQAFGSGGYYNYYPPAPPFANQDGTQAASPGAQFAGYHDPNQYPPDRAYGYYCQPGGFPPVPSPQEAGRNKKGVRVFAIILAIAVTAISFFSVGFLASQELGTDDSGRSDKKPSASSPAGQNSGSNGTSSFDLSVNSNSAGNAYTYEQVAEMVGKSVVSITIYTADGKSGAYASGIIMTEDGYVLTNDHIYSGIPAPKLLVTLNDGTEYKADFVAGDSRSDLSIIKLENASGLTPATFGASAALKIGEEVIAIGQSAGFSDTVTNGIVSSKDRRVASSDGYNEKYIQTTAAINPGNSGGALVNMSGEVIGVTSAKIVDDTVEGICFAIPSDIAVAIVKNMQENGKVVGRAKLGITYSAIGTIAAEINGVPKGIYIASISQDSGLYGKGIEVGDIITQVNGKAILTSEQLLNIIEEASAGDSIDLIIYKASSGNTVTVTAVLTEFVGSTNYTTNTGNSSDLFGSESEEDFLLPNPGR